MWAPSMPPLSEPSSKLSRVTGQDACLVTCTSFMPYLANNPFSWAMIKGAESVRAMNPSSAAVTSGASAGLMLTAGAALGDAPPAAGVAHPLDVVELELQPWARRVPAAVAPAVMMNFLLERLLICLELLLDLRWWKCQM